MLAHLRSFRPSFRSTPQGTHMNKTADRVAEEVIQMPEPQLQRTGADFGEDSGCRNPQAPPVCLQTQRVEASDTEQMVAPPIVHEMLRSSGQPLDPVTRAFMEPRFGHNFADVRVHSDTQAAEAARELNALAYTVGRDVVFNAGQYTPGTSAGRRLIAHELTHVVQQSLGGSSAPTLAPGSQMEHEADSVSQSLMSGRRALPVALKSGIGVARTPQTKDLTKLSDAQLQAEYSRVGVWLSKHTMIELEYGETEEYLEAIENEVRRRESGFPQESLGIRSGGFTANAAIQSYDATVRVNDYVKPAEDLATKVFEDYKSGKISHLQAREMASQARNELLAATRQKLSPGGKAFSEAIKEEGKTLPELVTKYSESALKKNPELSAKYGLKTLDKTSPLFEAAKYETAMREVGESALASEEIIKAAGRTGKTITVLAKFTKVAGPIGTAIGVGISGYEVITAPEGEKLDVFGRETSGLAGGTLGSIGGGLVAGWTASLLCGPGAPVCAIVVSLVVVGGAAYAGSVAGEQAYGALPSALETIGRIQLSCVETCKKLPWCLARLLPAGMQRRRRSLMINVQSSHRIGIWRFSHAPARDRVSRVISNLDSMSLPSDQEL